jgi:hypothetical protein
MQDIGFMMNTANAGTNDKQGAIMTVTNPTTSTRTISDNRASVRRAWLAMNLLSPRHGAPLGDNATASSRRA